MSTYNIVLSTNESTVVTEYEPQTKRSDAYQSEAALEAAFIKMLGEQGYEYVTIHSPDALIQESWPCPSPPAALGRAGPAPCLGSTVELVLNVGFSDELARVFFFLNLIARGGKNSRKLRQGGCYSLYGRAFYSQSFGHTFTALRLLFKRAQG